MATATKSEFSHVTLEEAGLLDYFTNQFVPVPQVDRYYHHFPDPTIRDCSSTGMYFVPSHYQSISHCSPVCDMSCVTLFVPGMSIVYSEPYRKDTPDISRINSISRSTFSNNLGKRSHLS